MKSTSAGRFAPAKALSDQWIYTPVIPENCAGEVIFKPLVAYGKRGWEFFWILEFLICFVVCGELLL